MSCVSNSPTAGAIMFLHGGARIGAGRKPRLVLPPAADIDRWYCVYTRQGGELLADIEIRRAGFTTFAPLVWKAATLPRRNSRGAVRPGKPDRIVPLFPRYLFVRFNRGSPDWARIAGLRGVEYIVGATPQTPRPVADETIDLIRGIPGMAVNGCVYPVEVADERPLPIKAGTPVAIASGPFGGRTGICTWSDGRRVRVLLEIMGRTVPVPMPQALVEAA